MWMGKWNREISKLYDDYYDMFGIEPDCYDEIDYDDLSYKCFVKLIKKSVLSEYEIPEAIRRSRYSKGV